MKLIPWTEIESFHNIRKYTKSHPEILNGNNVVYYLPKVKLHGTNAAVQVHYDGTVVAQSRTSLLVDGNDNAGFAKWVESNKTEWLKFKRNFVYFGEWFGTGIQKGVACSEINKKAFAVFAARSLDEGNDSLVVDPDELIYMVSPMDNLYVLPWYDQEIEVDWSSESDALTSKVEEINKWVGDVEKSDPWIKCVFNIDGTGEGLVFYPFSKQHRGAANYANLVFKAKGEAHKNIKTASPAQIDAASASDIKSFVDMVLTLARLEQGVTVVNGSLVFEMKTVGKFITWIQDDVKKECQDELDASELTFDAVKNALTTRARTWYLDNAKRL